MRTRELLAESWAITGDAATANRIEATDEDSRQVPMRRSLLVGRRVLFGLPAVDDEPDRPVAPLEWPCREPAGLGTIGAWTPFRSPCPSTRRRRPSPAASRGSHRRSGASSRRIRAR